MDEKSGGSGYDPKIQRMRRRRLVGMRKPSLLMALEPRVMFDGAGMATGADVVADATAPDASDQIPVTDTAQDTQSVSAESSTDSASTQDGTDPSNESSVDDSPAVSGEEQTSPEVDTDSLQTSLDGTEPTATQSDEAGDQTSTDASSPDPSTDPFGSTSTTTEAPSDADNSLTGEPNADPLTPSEQADALTEGTSTETEVLISDVQNTLAEADTILDELAPISTQSAELNTTTTEADEQPTSATSSNTPRQTHSDDAASDESGTTEDTPVDESPALAAYAPPETGVREVIFIDSSVTDHEQLVQGILNDSIHADTAANTSDSSSPPVNSDTTDVPTIASTSPEPQIGPRPSLVESETSPSAEQENSDLSLDLSDGPLLLGDVQIFLLDGNQDGIEQITDVLAGFQELAGVHIVSHGTNGSVKAGSTWLRLDNLNAYANDIATWQQAFRDDGDLLFYGCDLASNAEGQQLVDTLSELTGADVAASTDDTGHESFGGDWNLEYQTGAIETAAPLSPDAQSNWENLLAVITVDTTVDAINGDTSSVANLIASDGGDGISLREAIIATNNTAGEDTIFLPAGKFKLTLAGDKENAAATGDLDITDDLIITGAGISATTIDGHSRDRVFDVRSGTVSFSGITVEKGDVAIINEDGGGLQINAGADVTVSDALITNNDARIGGAIVNWGTLSLTDVTIDANTSDLSGGGLANRGVATLTGVTVSNNTNLGANDGGGIESQGGTDFITLTNVTISGNASLSSEGGGIFVSDGTLQNVTITNNSADKGGGFFSPGTVTLRNTLIAGNTASIDADVSAVVASLGNNLIGDVTGSSGWVGGDILNVTPTLGVLADNGGPTQTHAILAGSRGVDEGSNTGAPATDQRGVLRDAITDIGAYENEPPLINDASAPNLDENSAFGTSVYDVNDANTGNDTDIDADPISYAITDGNTGGAFAINGATGEITVNTPAVLDFETNPVFNLVINATDGNLNDTATITVNLNDIPNTLTVTTTADTSDGDTSSIEALNADKGADGQISLREAIIATNNTTGADTLNLSAGTYTLTIAGQGEDAAATGDLDITDDLTITGTGVGATVIDGNSLDRVLDVISGTVALSDLSIQDGNVTGSGDGGGVWNRSAADLSMGHVVISNSQADSGGAIHNDGTLWLGNSTLDGNTTTGTGAGLNNLGSAALSGVTISGNNATGDGGGVFNDGTSSFNATNVTISGNSADRGAGLYHRNGIGTLQNVTVTDNTATGRAGGVEVRGSQILNTRNTIIAGNAAPSSVDLEGNITSLGYNLIGDSAGGGGYDLINDILDVAPLLGTLQDNGGPTFTHALLAGSPAIDNGSNSGAPVNDQRVYYLRDGSTDIGAYEFGAPQNGLIVDTANDVADAPNYGTPSFTIPWLLGNRGADGKISLSEAIDAANRTPNGAIPDVIQFGIDTGLQTITVASSGLPWINDPVILDATTQPGYSGTPLIQLDGSATAMPVNGIQLRASDSVIKGFIVHSFGDEGIEIVGSTGFGDNNVIQNNWVGIDATGAAAPNAEHGIILAFGASGNLIGGSGVNEGNVISGNNFSGIVLRDSGTDNNTIQGNLIGVRPDGVTPQANGQNGIELSTAVAGNTVGGIGLGEGNVIAFNTWAGISVNSDAGIDNAILGNEVFANLGIGIDLGGDGVTDNDTDDVDGGPNNLQNFPALTQASTDEIGTITIDGSLDGTATTTYRVEFFASVSEDTASSPAHGEAERYLGFTTVITDASGDVTFSAPISATVADGEFITAIATVDLGGGNYGDSSEFAANIVATKNSSPVINDATAPNLDEHSALGTSVYNLDDANTGNDTDIDSDPITYSITNGNTGGAFAINGTTGAITVANSAALDFETTPVFNLEITATDGSLNDTAILTVNLNNLDDNDPIINNDTVVIDENLTNGTTVYDVNDAALPVDDFDLDGDAISYTITNGNTGGAFVITDASTGVITVANSAALDFETNPGFALEVTASDGTGAVDTAILTVNLNNLDDNDPIINNDTVVIDENLANGTTVYDVNDAALPVDDFDLDGDAISYTITNGNTGGAFVITDASTGVITVANSAALDFETNPSFALEVTASDGTGAVDTAIITVNLNNLDDNDPIINNDTVVIDENLTNGTTVYDVNDAALPVDDFDLDGDAISYTITNGNTGGAFVITDASTGVITVANSAALDFETNPSFALEVTASDGTGAVDTAIITVNLNNLDDNDPIINNDTVVIDENLANGTTVYDVNDAALPVDDFDLDGDAISYTITNGNTGGAFVITDASTGVITVANSAALDFETNPGFALEVTASDGTGAVDTAILTVNLNNLDDNDPIINNDTVVIDENLANGTTVYDVNDAALPVDDFDLDGDAISYTITNGNTGGAFVITDASTGVITVANSAALDFETNPGFALEVTASDGTGAVDTAILTVNLNNLDDNDPIINNDTVVIDENLANGTTVYDVNDAALPVDDFDLDGDAISYTITNGNTGGAFVITDASTGVITVANSAALDFETNPGFALEVTASDGTGAVDTAILTVNLNNLDDNDPIINNDTVVIDENLANGTTVYDVNDAALPVDDFDLDGDAISYTITNGNTGGAFVITDASTGVITVANSAALDFETNPGFALEVTASDGTGAVDTAIITVNLNDANEAPLINDASAPNLDENSVFGTSVYNVNDANTTNDNDVDGDPINYSITSGNTGGAFTINSATGAITVATPAALDFETNPVFNLEVTATDGSLNDTAIITVNLNDANEAPLINDASAPNLDENSAFGTGVYNVNDANTSSDSDVDGDPINYTITNGNTGGAFAINAGTGEITVNTPAALDFETNPVFNLEVTATDGALNDTAIITVNLNDVNEAPTVVLANTTNALSEDADTTSSVKVADIVVSDDALGTNTLAVTGTDSALFEIVGGNELHLKAGTTLDFETNPALDISVDVEDLSIGVSPDDTAVLAITVTDVNEAPTGGNTPPVDGGPGPDTPPPDPPSGDPIVPDVDTDENDVLPALETTPPTETDTTASTTPIDETPLQLDPDVDGDYEDQEEYALIKPIANDTPAVAAKPQLVSMSAPIPITVPLQVIKHALQEAVAEPLPNEGIKVIYGHEDIALGSLPIPTFEVSSQLSNLLDTVKEQMHNQGWLANDKILLSTALGATAVLSAGYVSWILKSGSLAAALLATTPLWRQFDPLPVFFKTKPPSEEDEENKVSPQSDDNRIDNLFESREKHQQQQSLTLEPA